MNERQTILKTYARVEDDGGQAILATLVGVQGSSYRLPGARMLIDESGRSVGAISGGCLETDVLERAARVLKTGEPTVIIYDTTRNDESIFGLGMGCRGIIRVLLEPARGNKTFDFLRDCDEQRKRGAAAILIDAPKDFPHSVGAKFFFSTVPESQVSGASLNSGFEISDGERAIENSIGEDLFRKLTGDLNRMFSGEQTNAANGAKIYKTEQGAVEFFLEIVAPPVSLLLFGAGYDALPVAGFAKNLGWRVSVIDRRAAFANRERFPDADEIIVARGEDLDAQTFEDENFAAVLMTHNYEQDREILRRLLHSQARYIGALGPKTRAEKLLAEIGGNFSDQQLSRLYAPVGLDIGAETPEEIALAVLGEIRGALANRTGGFLRARDGGIH